MPGPSELTDWYLPHVEAWSRAAKPAATPSFDGLDALTSGSVVFTPITRSVSAQKKLKLTWLISRC